jgi:hypothetical protein
MIESHEASRRQSQLRDFRRDTGRWCASWLTNLESDLVQCVDTEWLAIG